MYTGFISLIDYTVIQCILCIVGAKQADVPWTLGLLFRLGAFVRLTQVDEVVGAVVDRLADDGVLPMVPIAYASLSTFG